MSKKFKYIKITLGVLLTIAICLVGIFIYYFNGWGIDNEEAMGSEIHTLFQNAKGDIMGINDNGDTINLTEEPYYIDLVAPDAREEIPQKKN